MVPFSDLISWVLYRLFLGYRGCWNLNVARSCATHLLIGRMAKQEGEMCVILAQTSGLKVWKDILMVTDKCWPPRKTRYVVEMP